MRVLTVVDALRLGGAETLIAQLARVSAAADLEVSVLSVHGYSPELSRLAPLLQEAGVEPIYLGASRTLDVMAFLRLVRYIRCAQPDVVHAHLEMAMTMAIPAAALAGIPAVGTFHTLHQPLNGRALWRERLALEVVTRSKAAIFVSRASLRSFADRYRQGRRVPASWKVVHNGVDLDYFAKAEPSGVLATLPPGLSAARLVTIVARRDDVKGIIHAIRAWPSVVARVPDAKLLLVGGSGTAEQALHSEVSDLAVEDSVIFTGLRNDIPAILQASEVVLLPSLDGENLPTVLMEAGGCERPVVASDVGGVSDIVSDGETGLLTPPGDAAAIARAVISLLEDQALATRLGVAGRQRMERLFDAKIWARSLRDVYEEAIASHHKPSGRKK